MRVLLALLAWGSACACLAMGKPLVVCLEQESPPYSTIDGGIDNAVALLVADAMGLPLIIRWYETDSGDEGNPALQVNALLSSGQCELAGGFALAQNNFANPGQRQFSVQATAGERQLVDLQPLAPSLPYHAQVFTLVWPAKTSAPPPTSLDDLLGLSILVEENSVADLILMTHGGGTLRKSIRHLKAGGDTLLKTLSTGSADGAWLAQHHFENWLQRHHDSPLQASGLVYGFGINLGFATLKSNQQLLERLDEILIELMDEGGVELLFAAQGLTYSAPQRPYLMPPLSARLLAPK